MYHKSYLIWSPIIASSRRSKGKYSLVFFVCVRSRGQVCMCVSCCLFLVLKFYDRVFVNMVVDVAVPTAFALIFQCAALGDYRVLGGKKGVGL